MIEDAELQVKAANSFLTEIFIAEYPIPPSRVKLHSIRQDLQDLQDFFVRYGYILSIQLILSEKMR